MAGAAQLHRTLHNSSQFSIIPRLGYKVYRTRLYRPHRLLGVDICRDEEHHRLAIPLQYEVKPSVALLPATCIAAEIHVKEDHIRMKGIHKLTDTFRIGDYADPLDMLPQQHIERQQHVLIVIHNQYLSSLLCILCHIISLFVYKDNTWSYCLLFMVYCLWFTVYGLWFMVYGLRKSSNILH